MSAQGQQLKRYMAETIVPAVQRVKGVHEKLEDEGQQILFSLKIRFDNAGILWLLVDMAYGTGLLAFNEVCKRVEAMALQTEDEIDRKSVV